MAMICANKEVIVMVDEEEMIGQFPQDRWCSPLAFSNALKAREYYRDSCNKAIAMTGPAISGPRFVQVAEIIPNFPILISAYSENIPNVIFPLVTAIIPKLFYKKRITGSDPDSPRKHQSYDTVP